MGAGCHNLGAPAGLLDNQAGGGRVPQIYPGFEKRVRPAGESYVAGGVALNQLLLAPRRSRDIDLFHDTAESLAATWADDRALLGANGYTLQPLREASSFVEARVLH